MKRPLANFLDLVHLQAEMNKIFEALQSLEESQPAPGVAGPIPYDVMETPEHLVIELDLPGVLPDSLKIAVKDSILQVQGEWGRPRPKEIVAFHLMERQRGAFTRRIPVDGAFDTANAVATYERGVLAIHLPRLQERRGRTTKVPVQIKD
jgi:HSP20 family protein